jgi:beta-phosphoglucomutase-like phosphatase (HAD superfamily)
MMHWSSHAKSPANEQVACRWHTAKTLPGAMRLLHHLHGHGIPFAIATSTCRESFNRKLSTHQGLEGMCQVWC